MPVIVFNKRTGKYLKRHSGSYRHKWNTLRYRGNVQERINKKFGKSPLWREDREVYNKYHGKVNAFLKDMICDAAPEDARVYATEGSALSSVGAWGAGSTSNKYHLPDYLEMHEIKEAFVCVMRPDGSSNCDEEEAK